MYPAGTSGRLDVANVADEDVVLVTFTTFAGKVPEPIVTLLSVRFPTVLVVPPKVRVALPSVTVLLAR